MPLSWCLLAGVKQFEVRGGSWEGVGLTSPRRLEPGDVLVLRCRQLRQYLYCGIGGVVRSWQDEAPAAEAVEAVAEAFANSAAEAQDLAEVTCCHLKWNK
jgi:hypothetical protein